MNPKSPVLLAVLSAVLTLPLLADEHGLTPDQALARLTEGNQRFVAGKPTHPDESADRRHDQAKAQTPFAVVLTCADSRVSPELYFDQGIGDVFVIRNAGNVLDDHVIGSIEYAIEHLHVHLVIVVGHASCGAVSAAVAGGHAPGHIGSIVESIQPALEQVKDQPGDKVDNTVRANASRVADLLRHSEPIVSEAVHTGEVKVVAGRYDLDSGAVEILN